MNLSQLRPPKGQKQKEQRIGQGMGSGRGKFSGRGAKGAKSISGYSRMRGFEGGQMPLHRRLPKRGFTNIFRIEYCVVNLDRIAELNQDTINPDVLRKAGVVRKSGALVKILSVGELNRAVTVHAHKFSKAAVEKITKAGGKVEVIPQQVKFTRPEKVKTKAKAKA